MYNLNKLNDINIFIDGLFFLPSPQTNNKKIENG